MRPPIADPITVAESSANTGARRKPGFLLRGILVLIVFAIVATLVAMFMPIRRDAISDDDSGVRVM